MFATPPPGANLCQLDTERLRLRPYEARDAAVFFRVLDESRARLQLSFPDRLRSVPTLAAAPTQLAAFAQDWRTGRFYVFGIWHQQTQAYLGDICLMPQRGGQAEIGYYLAAEAEGQGYAREALGAIVRFGFGQVGATRLLIRCFIDNVRAQQVARAHGFRLLGEEPATEGRSWFHFNLWDTSPPLPAILHFVRERRQSAT
ncbi:GNAT family N-acetyltransferase [Hymenobacter sp. BT559]|uniref:GNAT family N-acetyltransferase n=1 Tax=Hymenobacter sp. BT559 TaxID=2795729 RepID=UPI0018EB178F|nr:GNAT family protein [Hymenobacter sp. BT559]MBJ6144578.1 GNAT family N-acetyltransferase [Hymenobacter sp. BT559]